MEKAGGWVTARMGACRVDATKGNTGGKAGTAVKRYTEQAKEGRPQGMIRDWGCLTSSRG